MSTLAPTVTLNDGRDIPQLGLGTWPMDDATAEHAIATAIGLGYRHIDTAVKYGNERGVGRGVAAAVLARDEVWVTTKLDGAYQGEGRAVTGLAASLDRLGLDYVDLLLIHWPLPARDLYVDTWRTFIELREQGLARSIGVSNFTAAHLRRLVDETGVAPAVNQIQVSPHIPRRAQRAASVDLGVVVQSWSPLAPGSDLLDSPAVAAIAAAHDRTPAQVVLRWHVQQGLVAIPKSQDPGRMAANLAVFDFALSPSEIAAIDGLSHGESAGVDSEVAGH